MNISYYYYFPDDFLDEDDWFDDDYVDIYILCMKIIKLMMFTIMFNMI